MKTLKKRLTKSRTNVILTGTLGGIGEYIGIDPTIIRVIYVIFSIFLIGSPVLLYILLALVIPSGKKHDRATDYRYGHENPYYQNNQYRQDKPKRKEAEKINDDDWSDF